MQTLVFRLVPFSLLLCEVPGSVPVDWALWLRRAIYGRKKEPLLAVVGWQGRKCDSVPESVFKSPHGSEWGSPRAFQQAFASGCLSLEENKETSPSVCCESSKKWVI